MKIGDLITKYVKDNDISYRDFAIKCDISNAYISMIVNDRNPKTGKPAKLTIETYSKIAHGMGMSIKQLFSVIDNAPVVLGAEGTIFEEPSNVQPKRIPFIVSASGGNPILSEETYIYGTGVPLKADYAIRMIGNSMEPTFLDGDVVYVKEGTQIKDGSIAAVIINEEVTLRRLYNQKDGLLLVCDNPACRPFFAASNGYDVVKIIGKPIGFRRMFAEDE